MIFINIYDEAVLIEKKSAKQILFVSLHKAGRIHFADISVDIPSAL
jgi:hypothetical protein